MIHSRVSWIFLPVERSITVSAPHLVAQRIFSTSSSMLEATALFPILALIFTRKLRPPLGGPAHLLHFLLDERSDGAVPDIGVDLHQEIAPPTWWPSASSPLPPR